MKTTKQTSPCHEIIKSLVSIEIGTNIYYIPQDLNLDKYPQEVIDGFLDLMNTIAPTQLEKSNFLRLVMEDVITVKCKD
jgi:hypothetical protein